MPTSTLSSQTPLQDQAMIRALLEWADAVGWQRGSVIVYLLADGQYRFSETSVLQQIDQIVEEAALSDRLLLIICAAHLEDQIRTVLAQFFIDDKLVEDMFERSSASFMTSLAYSLGLIAKEWHDVLKSISRRCAPSICCWKANRRRDKRWSQ